jgi:hypothetical protein
MQGAERQFMYEDRTDRRATMQRLIGLKVSSGPDFHRRALQKPCVNFSIHKIPLFGPFHDIAASEQRASDYTKRPCKPVSRPGLVTQPFELTTRPADDREIDPLQGRTQLRRGPTTAKALANPGNWRILTSAPRT